MFDIVNRAVFQGEENGFFGILIRGDMGDKFRIQLSFGGGRGSSFDRNEGTLQRNSLISSIG